MHDGIDELDDLMQRASATPWGKTCSALWAQAAVMAEERSDMEKAVRCYGELCAAYMMGGESTRVIAPFMWLDTMFKSHPEYFHEQDITALGWYYKYVISTVRCVPTVPVAQCEALLDEMHTYYTQRGDSMRAYHIRSYLFHRDMLEMDEAEESYAKWQSAEHSELADCERCDPGYEVAYYARQERWEEAVAAGDKALATEGEFCDSQPEALLTEMMVPWLHVGRDTEAWAAHIRAYRRYQQAPRYFEYLQDHFLYLALSGRAGRPDRLERGLTILARHMPWWTEAEHPRVLMDTAVAVYVLLDSFPIEQRQRVLPVTLPGEDLRWVSCDSIENPTIERAAEWMRELAFTLAEQFDARPGHRHPGAEKIRVEGLLYPTLPPRLPEQDVFKDVTGLGEYRSAMTVTMTPATLQPSANAAMERPAEQTSQTSEEAQATSTSTDEEPPMVPLPVNGDWQQMSPLELLHTAWRIAPNTETIYSLQLVYYLRCHPHEREVFFSSLPPELHRAGQWILHTLQGGETMEYQPWEGNAEAHSEDSAVAMVIRASDLLDEGKLMEAAQTADTATRTPSVDPNGVRVAALAILANAAERAGYTDEAIESYRDATNLCALLGLKVDQALLSWRLATSLGKKKRWAESAEVAQNALDLLDMFPQVWAYRIRLLSAAATANSAMNYYDAAAAYHHEAAALFNEQGDVEGAIAAFRAAAETYTEAMDFRRAIDAYAAVPPLVEKAIAGARLELELADPHDEANYKKQYEILSNYHRDYSMALYSYARAIVSQPGSVPAADIELMEQVMNTLRSFITHPDHDQYLLETIQWRHADWLSDIALMHWYAYQYSVAMDEQRASIAEFETLGDVEALAQRILALGQMHRLRHEVEQARACAQRAFDVLSDARFAGSRTRREARELLKELETDEI